MRRSMACVALVAAGTFAFSVLAVSPAENFPEKPIKLIVPFGPGGPPDVAARIIGAYLSDHLGPVVVENHVGAGGILQVIEDGRLKLAPVSVGVENRMA